MATTYSADRTAAQAPATAPEPEKELQLQLPADGDLPAASLFAQPFKVLADAIEWLFQPKAKGGSFTQPIVRYRNAAGYAAGAIDHLGFPAGQIVCEDTTWSETSAASIANATADIQIPGNPLWRCATVETTGSLSVAVGTLVGTACAFPILQICPGATVADAVLISRLWNAFADSNHLTMEVPAGWSGATDTQRDIAIGLGARDLSQFAGFFKLNGTANWQCRTTLDSVSTTTDSGVPVSVDVLAPDRLRVEWHGSSVQDPATGRAARFYINGTLVQTHTANLPLTKVAYAVIKDTNVTGASNTQKFDIGPIKLRARSFLTDSVY